MPVLQLRNVSMKCTFSHRNLLLCWPVLFAPPALLYPSLPQTDSWEGVDDGLLDSSPSLLDSLRRVQHF